MKNAYFFWAPGGTWLAHIFKAITKQHHKELRPIFERSIPASGIVLDVGAHAGQYAKLFSKIAYRGQVFSVEPGSYARSILRPALFFNGCKNVTVLPFALGSGCKVEVLQIPIKRKGSHGFGLSHLEGESGNIEGRFAVVHDITVSVSLDELSTRLKLDRLDFIKIDIEGWEMRALEGGADTIERFKPIIMVEFVAEHLKRAGDTLEGAWAKLEAMDYLPYILTNDGDSLTPLSAPQDGDIWWQPSNRSSC